VKRLLHERVEAGRRLVEDQQLRVVHERLNQPHLLLVAVRVLAVLAMQIQVEPCRQIADTFGVDTAAQMREQIEYPRPGVIRIFGRFAG
jgi:hypothetical protein